MVLIVQIKVYVRIRALHSGNCPYVGVTSQPGDGDHIFLYYVYYMISATGNTHIGVVFL